MYNLKKKQKSLVITGANTYAFVFVLFCCLSAQTKALSGYKQVDTALVTSTQQQAMNYLESVKDRGNSNAWPNIKPALFFDNLRSNINRPISIYPGSGTNFCGYGALTYLMLKDDPLSYAKLLIQLYREGKASFRGLSFNPSDAVKKEAGLLKFKGILDIHPAEQMWYLSLADHFKGYLNFFNRKFDPGDENKFWASVNYAKFNHMIKKMLHYKVSARGGDILRPRTEDLYQYISNKIETGMVILFINNRIVHKKNHVTIKLGVPTHFIVADKIIKENGLITLVYWDYGGRTLMQLSPAFFKRIVFGITHCTKIETDAQ
jgi:hypothetical protein